MNLLLDSIAAVGSGVIAACRVTGSVTLFAAIGLSHLVRPPFYGRLFVRALLEIGYFSLPVVALTAIFTGMVLALQSYTGFARFSAEGAVANVVVLSITRELGPVLAGLMVAGRIGAAMAAEIGTMRVTDQIDALSTLSTNPMKYLVTPRLLAGIVALPMLVVVADILGVLGGFIVSTLKLGFNVGTYLRNTLDFMQAMDVTSGLVKAAVFGFLIALMGCYQGYNSRGGAEGVGAATTAAVVECVDPDPGVRLCADRDVLRAIARRGEYHLVIPATRPCAVRPACGRKQPAPSTAHAVPHRDGRRPVQSRSPCRGRPALRRSGLAGPARPQATDRHRDESGRSAIRRAASATVSHSRSRCNSSSQYDCERTG